MGITLRDAMNIFPFSGAKLIAGQQGLGRAVLSANIQEVPSVDRWLKGGEILFTAGYAFQSAEKGCEMMERLDQVGIAALAIKPGQYLPRIPEEMVTCANYLGLPLFELPQDLPYMDCIIAIFERVTQEQFAIMRRAERIHEMLTESILNKEGLDGICAVLGRMTGNPVFIAAPDGTFFACRLNAQEAGSPDLESIKAMFEDYVTTGRDRGLKPNQCNVVTPDGGMRLVVVPICVRGEHIAHLALVPAGGEMADADMMAFEQAGSMVAVELLNEKTVWQREQKIREQLLDDLLMKRYNDEKMVIQRGSHLGFDMTGKYCIFVIDADSFEETLKNDRLSLSEEKIQHIKTQVQQKIRAGISAYSRPSLVLDNGVGAVGMLSVRRGGDVLECVACIDKIIADLERLDTNLTFSAGVGRVKQGVQHVEQARREAELAMRAGRGMGRRRKKHRTHAFGDLGCLCFLNELSGSLAMRDFYEENMRTLLDYDRDNKMELVKTLEYYFFCKQNLRMTAEALFVHKNSVVYRLGKIEALLGKELDDYQTAFDLQLCLKLRSIF